MRKYRSPMSSEYQQAYPGHPYWRLQIELQDKESHPLQHINEVVSVNIKRLSKVATNLRRDGFYLSWGHQSRPRWCSELYDKDGGQNYKTMYNNMITYHVHPHLPNRISCRNQEKTFQHRSRLMPYRRQAEAVDLEINRFVHAFKCHDLCDRRTENKPLLHVEGKDMCLGRIMKIRWWSRGVGGYRIIFSRWLV